MSRTNGRPPGRTIGRAVRAKVWRTYGRICYSRKSPDCTGVATQIDHVIPWAEGGTDDIENLRPTCLPCHDEKSERERLRGVKRRQAKSKRPKEPHPSEGLTTLL